MANEDVKNTLLLVFGALTLVLLYRISVRSQKKSPAIFSEPPAPLVREVVGDELLDIMERTCDKDVPLDLSLPRKQIPVADHMEEGMTTVRVLLKRMNDSAFNLPDGRDRLHLTHLDKCDKYLDSDNTIFFELRFVLHDAKVGATHTLVATLAIPKKKDRAKVLSLRPLETKQAVDLLAPAKFLSPLDNEEVSGIPSAPFHFAC